MQEMQEEQWEAIVRCDAEYDGRFFYAVLTTGIFCRPSCKSRTPKPTNVRVFHSADEAVRARFRACKRCRPDQLQRPDEVLVRQVKQVVETRYAESLTLDRIARELHLSPYHLHKVFKRVTGTTPAQVVMTTRLEQAKRLLRESAQSITDIALMVGFGNVAHFSTVFQKGVGVSPSVYRVREQSCDP